MATKIYVGNSENLSKEVTKVYAGSGSNISKKAKKTYVGNTSGIASIVQKLKLLLSKHTGTISNLSEGKNSLSAESVGNYAIFAGGGASAPLSSVDAYDTSLTKTVPTTLSTGRRGSASASVGNYALFAGGYDCGGSVDAYDIALTKSIAPALKVGRSFFSAASTRNHAIFNSGRYVTNHDDVPTEAYDSSLTKSFITELHVGCAGRWGAAISFGDYALFGGGYGNSSSTPFTDVNAYDSSLTKLVLSDLSGYGRCNLTGTSNGIHAIFGGGKISKTYTVGMPLYPTSIVDAYNTSLTKLMPTQLSGTPVDLAAAPAGEYSIFAGGGSNIVNAYDASLTRSLPAVLGGGRSCLAATSIGNYALFGGGDYYSAAVEAYQVS